MAAAATSSDMPSDVNLVIVCACAKIAQFLAPDFLSHDRAMQIPILRVRACRSPSLDVLVEMEAITMLQFAAGVGLFCAFVVFYFYKRRNGHSKVRIVLWRPSCFWYCINMLEFNR